jgi:hypothetical protein
MTLPFPSRWLSIALLLASACTSGDRFDALVPGRPAFGPVKTDSFVITTRLPGSPEWGATLTRADGGWKVVTPDGETDRADAAFTEHFLEILSTFETVEEAGKGTDAGFGFAPYRVFVRFSPSGPTLQFGDPTGGAGIFFRRIAGDRKLKPEERTWIGRGALVPFIANLRDPSAFRSKSFFSGRIEDVERITLERTEGGATWSIDLRKDASPADRPVRELADKLVHQRIQGLDRAAKPEGKPDWKILLELAGGRRETVEVFFDLDRVLARNPARSDAMMELYPEFAGTLRAFTQARSTQVRSPTK